jgi:UDP-glucose 4-epimerase
MNIMNVLLAGGAGYIGSHTAVELLNAGYQVVIVDDYSNSSPEAVHRIEKITGKRVISMKPMSRIKKRCVISFLKITLIVSFILPDLRRWGNRSAFL